jgi:SOUL heme-binding protein
MWWLIAVGAVVLLGAALSGPIVSNVEQPKYRVVESSSKIEIRDYAPMIVAEAEVSGNQRDAIGKGFRIIADYIFGNNTAAQQGNGNTWRVRFIMPSIYTMETLPKPNNPAVELKKIEARRCAVIHFSGMADEDNLKGRTKELDAFISAKNLTPLSAPTYAFYNPPWTMPFLRRNEVMVEIARPRGE